MRSRTIIAKGLIFVTFALLLFIDSAFSGGRRIDIFFKDGHSIDDAVLVDVRLSVLLIDTVSDRAENDSVAGHPRIQSVRISDIDSVTIHAKPLSSSGAAMGFVSGAVCGVVAGLIFGEGEDEGSFSNSRGGRALIVGVTYGTFGALIGSLSDGGTSVPSKTFSPSPNGDLWELEKYVRGF